MARRKGTALAYILVWGLLSRRENLQNVNQNKLLLSLVLVCQDRNGIMVILENIMTFSLPGTISNKNFSGSFVCGSSITRLPRSCMEPAGDRDSSSEEKQQSVASSLSENQRLCQERTIPPCENNMTVIAMFDNLKLKDTLCTYNICTRHLLVHIHKYIIVSIQLKKQMWSKNI